MSSDDGIEYIPKYIMTIKTLFLLRKLGAKSWNIIIISASSLNIKFIEQAELEAVKTKVSGGGDMSLKEKVKLITELSDDISAATVSYHRLVKSCHFSFSSSLITQINISFIRSIYLSISERKGQAYHGA